MSTTDPVILTPQHAEALDRFLMTRPETSLVLLSNSRAAGLVDTGEIFQGTYAAYIEDGAIVGVAAHYWNGMVFLQAPEGALDLLRAATSASGRDWTGISGPYEQVLRVLPDALRAHPAPAMNDRDVLFSLRLDDLVVPGPLVRGDVSCRRPRDDELPGMIEMRVAFMHEHLGPGMRHTREEEAREIVRELHRTDRLRLLDCRGRSVATAAINAAIPEMVQVGAVYTAPEYRNRGYGRAVVAGLLLEARARGVQSAVLFTGTAMHAARRAYESIGFRPIGEYGLVIF